MMSEKLDQLLLILLGAGWSEKKVLDLVEELGALSASDIKLRNRTLRKALQKVRAPDTVGKSRTMPVDRAMKTLRSSGPYTESEIMELVASIAHRETGNLGALKKGGLRQLLLDLQARVGPDRMLELIKAVRNDLVHNPRPGWSITDVR